MKCPECGDKNCIEVMVSVWGHVREYENDDDLVEVPPNGIPTRTLKPDNPARCTSCEFTGVVNDFRIE